ncbi:MAG: LacI family DNA-binding transcriptional regulator [Meiothermus sp.]|nr:LacI family DNA-binding transcriptional regulator [Meiothermus sp.]
MRRKPFRSRVTSHEVALRAGVSQSTVSRVFSGGEGLSQATRQRVLDAARDLKYKPNAIARSLSTRRTQIIGLVSSHMTNPYFPLVLQAFTQRLHELGWKVLLISAGLNEDVDELLPEVLAYQVDGLVIVTGLHGRRITEEAQRQGLPAVLFGRYAMGSGVSAVSCANYEAGREVADAFLEASHRRLAYIGGLEDTSANVDRRKGFVERLAERGVGGCQEELGVFTYHGGYEAATRLLRSASPPDAIFCANDMPAFGVLDAARDLGVRVPDDLSVIGFDDIPMAQWSPYNLTTVRQPVEEMIEVTLELLLERIDNAKAGSVVRFLPGILVRRGSARLIH